MFEHKWYYKIIIGFNIELYYGLLIDICLRNLSPLSFNGSPRSGDQEFFWMNQNSVGGGERRKQIQRADVIKPRGLQGWVYQRLKTCQSPAAFRGEFNNV